MGSILRPFLNFFKTLWRLFLGYLRLHKKIYTWKNLLHIDNFLSMLTLFGAFFFFGWIGGTVKVLDPLGDAFEDVEITDITFSQLGKNAEYRTDFDPVDSNIVIVNIGNLPRPGIADLIRQVNACDPKVVGLDIFFEGAKPDAEGDMYLAAVLDQVENLVIMNKGNVPEDFDHEDSDEFTPLDSINSSFFPFTMNASQGPANMATREVSAGESGFKVVRKFLTYFELRDGDTTTTVPSFPVLIADKFAPEKVEKLKKRNNNSERINFAGNINVLDYDERYRGKNNFAPLQDIQLFRAVDWTDVLAGPKDSINQEFGFWPEMFKDKIVLFGFLGSEIYVSEGQDKFFTPLNEKYIGKAERDMYGVVVHANIIHTILNENYIDEMPDWTKHLTGIIVVFIVMASFRPVYNDYKVWYDGLTKVMGLVLCILLLFLIGGVFEYYNYEIKFGAIYYGCILLAGDFLEIYYGLIKNVFRVKR